VKNDYSSIRIALVHDWLTGMRGGEKVIEALCELYPDAPLLTLVHVPGSVSPAIERMRILPSIVNRVPGIDRVYRQALPLFPFAIEQFDLDDVDLIISTSHCAAKAVVRTGRASHLCYCHTPMRYVWDQRDVYFGRERMGEPSHRLLRPVLAGLARWDRETAHRVDRFVANSRHVAERIRRYYNREAAVVYPPVDTSYYTPDGIEPDRYLLIVSALSPYKRIDLAIDAAARVGMPLKIAGTGPDGPRLEAMAGSHVEFLGAVPDEGVRELFRRATAVLLPGEEDFGIAPVEAQACGRPVVALGRGGALETVIDGVTGILVSEPSPEAFADGIDRVQHLTLDPMTIREHALRFGRDRFVQEIRRTVDQLLQLN
jgi:glycosyltransferase involved in cell wall biosynthesis